MKPKVSEIAHRLQLQTLIAREERAKKDALLASLGEGIITTDKQGNISQINETALKILNCKKTDLIGKWFPKTIVALQEDGSIIQHADRAIVRALVQGTPISQRLFYKRKNGSVVPVSLTVSPIIFRGKPVGAIEVFRDITEEIENDRLKSEFISIASHQLRTPLSTINTYSRMLTDGYAGSLNEDQVLFVKAISSASERMNDLINTLLNITRIGAGSIRQVSEEVDVISLAQSTCLEVEQQAKEKNITISCANKIQSLVIKTDPLLVREILLNFLTNAVKYTPEKGKVTLKTSIKQNNFIFCVQDNGYGIPSSAHSKIFTKFFRASNVLDKDVSGTGLGLYLIKILAENLNGEVWFNSQLDKGSSFFFSLPLRGSEEKKGRFRLESTKVLLD